MYTFTKSEPMMITDYEEASARQMFLNSNDLIFKDSKNHIVLDVPPQYEGSRMLRTNKKYNEKTIKFKVN